VAAAGERGERLRRGHADPARPEGVVRVYFYEADHDAVIESLRLPIGRPNDYGPVASAQFLKKRLDAITVG
jgi:hypothetical protein